ncbi:MAG: SDR family oxidoreductase [Bdellovibrionales bacterium]|nr:SDR family oxidoreductase [Bdellovibrionales bacterium]
MKKPLALVTGAAGFVGSHLSERLLSEGYSVVGVDNLCTGRLRNLESFKDHPHFEFIKADLIEGVPPVLLGREWAWVFHFASPASPPKYFGMPLETLRINSEGTRHLLELCKKTGARFFFASTSEVYGDPLEHPQREEYWGNVNPIGVRSIYDEAKRYGEAITYAYHRTHGVDVRVIRIFNTYGPRMDPEDGRVVTNLMFQALKNEPLTLYGDGSQTRSFQYVSDLVEGILRLMNAAYVWPVNLGNPGEFTILEFAQKVRALISTAGPDVFLPLPSDDPKQRKPDIRLAKRLLDWEPQVELGRGLELTLDYFKTREF